VDSAAGVFGTAIWNNLDGPEGDVSALVADVAGTATATEATVVWASNNTWSSQGRSENNNDAPDGDDRNLMTGYLDTNGSDPNSVTFSDIPFQTYDVYVYTKGGVIGRGGEYTIGDVTQAHVDTAPFSGDYVLGEEGDYLVFAGVSGSSFTLSGLPTTGSPARAPINAIEIVEAAVAPGGGGGASIEISTDGDGNIVLTFVGNLVASDNVEGPYTAVAGASNPMVVAPDQARRFYQTTD
jgi:hypothetical protein